RRWRKRPKKVVYIDPVGYDAGKKIKDVKRKALVDNAGHLLLFEVISANIKDPRQRRQSDREGAAEIPEPEKVFGDGGGPQVASQRVGLPPVALEIVKRINKNADFKVVRRRG